LVAAAEAEVAAFSLGEPTLLVAVVELVEALEVKATITALHLVGAVAAV
jgi:hypothetical protein